MAWLLACAAAISFWRHANSSFPSATAKPRLARWCRSSGRLIFITSTHCSSPSSPVVTNLTIQATRPPQVREQTPKYPAGPRTPKLATVPDQSAERIALAADLRTRAATLNVAIDAFNRGIEPLCGAVAEPIVRNAQEKRQLALIEKYLTDRGYELKAPPAATPLTQMEPATFTFRLNVLVKPSKAEAKSIKIPIDAVIQPKRAKLPHLPLLIEAKSAGDFTNVNKRRKEEATKINQLKATYGDQVVFVLFLCGYFDAAYLGYEAAEGIDWIWEHRIEDINRLGI